MKSILFTILMPAIGFSQNAILGAGGEAIGTGGSASYSLGQVFDGFSSNGTISIQEGVQQTYILSTDGLIELSSETILLYPSPSIDHVNIEFKDENFNFNFVIISMEGYLMRKGFFNSPNSTIDLKDIPSGEYFIVLTSDTSYFKSKLIKI
jgi:hypothetical protein